MSDAAPPEPWHARRPARLAAYAGVWLGGALLVALVLFLHSSQAIVLASHDAVVRPDLSGEAVVHTGPVLPDVRVPSGSLVGVDIQLGKTEADSTDELVQRYAYIAGQPDGQVAKVTDAVVDLALGAALRGAVAGLVPVLVWVLVGRTRRRALLRRARRVRPRAAVAGGAVAVAAVAAVWQPWAGGEEAGAVGADRPWMSLHEFLGPQIPLPDGLDGVQVSGDVTTEQTRRLVASAVDTYDRSKTFYAAAAEQAAGLDLRRPRAGDTVVALISDRHDNIGMDRVERAVADAAGATAVLDAGDDTSAGKSWEAFSLDSVTTAFEDLDRWGVAGNHDEGDFVHGYLADHGWTMLDGEVVDGPGGTTLLGVDDPRSSGLGSWRDETGLSFDEVGSRLADAACAADSSGERVDTILVHDVDLGAEALRRGCADLVLGGHLHVRVGPERVTGAGGRVGYRYTTGTAGGAAYAIALGSKPRRDAVVSLVTYADGRPAGLQWVTLQTNGVFEVGGYRPLRYPDRPRG